MIGKVRYPDGRNYVCDDCEKKVVKFTNHSAAIKAGWAIARNRKNCYCPACAPNHRNTGRGGAAVVVPQPSWVPAGMKQETISLK